MIYQFALLSIQVSIQPTPAVEEEVIEVVLLTVCPEFGSIVNAPAV